MKSLIRLASGVLLLVVFAPQSQALPPQRSTQYNGNAYVSFPHRAEYDASVAMTIEAWVYYRDDGTFHTLVSHDFTQSYWFGITTGNKLRFYRSGGFPNYQDSSGVLTPYRWTHVAVTYDGATAAFYIDGQNAGSGALSNAGANKSAPLWLGGDPNGNLGLNGYLDEVRIWSNVRNQTTINVNKYSELTTGFAMAARFPAGGRTNAFANVVGTAVNAADATWGILPRDYVVPRALTPVDYNTDLSEFTINNAERIVWRYQTTGGAQRDVEGMMVYRNEFGDQNLYVALPSNPLSQDSNGSQILWFSAMFDPLAENDSSPQPNHFRIDSSVDNLSADYLWLRVGNGSDWVTTTTPAPGAGSWDVVDPAGCEFDCGRIFRIPRSMLEGFTQKRALFGEFAYAVSSYPRVNLPSAVGADSLTPYTWPYLNFEGASSDVPQVELSGRAINATAGVNTGLGGLTVRIFNGNSGTVYDTTTTDSSGFFNFGTVYVTDPSAPIRVTCSVPGSSTWRHLNPQVSGSDRPVLEASGINGVTYGNCGLGETCQLGTIEFRIIEYQSPVVSSISPSNGIPRIVLNSTAPRTTTPTRFTLSGSGLHDFTSFYLSHYRCDIPGTVGDPLPATGPNCTNFPLRVVNRAADWTWVELELDFDFGLRFNVPEEFWGRGPYRVLLHDDWTGAWRHSAAVFQINDNFYPWFYGFEFLNERDHPLLDEFFAVYQWNAFDCVTPFGPFPGANPCPGCRVPNGVYMFYAGTVFVPWVELMTGSCLGMSSTSLLLHNGDLNPWDFDPDAIYASGLLGTPVYDDDGSFWYYDPPKPKTFNTPFCDYSRPSNLWGQIHRNQAVQVSAEFFHNLLSQMHGTGLQEFWRYSIDGSPTNALATFRNHPFEYVLCFQNGGNVFEAHCVVPYRIEDGFGFDTNTITRVERPGSSLIYVYDSNHPKNEREFMEIDRTENRFRYFWGWREEVVDGVTNSVPVWWTGTGVYATPLSIWKNPRSMPGLDVVAHGLALALFGSADALIEDNSNRAWGWDAAGNLHDEYVGANAIAPFTSAPPPPGSQLPPANTNRTAWFFPPTNSPPARILANVRGPDWKFYVGELGVGCQLDVRGATAGVQDELFVILDQAMLNGFSYHPKMVMNDFSPSVAVVSSNRPSAVYVWKGLNVGGSQSVDFGATRENGGAWYRNGSALPTQHTLQIIRTGAEGTLTNEYGPFTVAPGSVQLTRLMEWPSVQLRSDLDWDDDGIIDSTTFLNPTQTEVPRPADGFSFNFASDLPDGTFTNGEEGEGSGLRVTFDTWDNGGADTAPAISVFSKGTEIATVSTAGYRAGNRPTVTPVPTDPFTGMPLSLTTGIPYANGEIVLYPGGLLDVYYKDLPVLAEVDTGYNPMSGRFGIGARTGGATETHYLDDLSIRLETEPAFEDHFEQGVPDGTELSGIAAVTPAGGMEDSGVLRLMEASNWQSSLFIIKDLNEGAPVKEFDASFKVKIFGSTCCDLDGAPRPADGFSFSLTPDAQAEAFLGEDGPSTGLVVSVDLWDNGPTWDNGFSDSGPAISIKYNGQEIEAASMAEPREPGRPPATEIPLDPATGLPMFITTGDQFVDMKIRLRSNGMMDVYYKEIPVLKNVATGYVPAPGEFAFASRTGAANAAVYIDDLIIGFKPAFESGFNAILPDGATAYGSAFQDDSGGINDSGTLKLTVNDYNQNGSLIIDDFNEGRPVEAFRAKFKVRLGDSLCCSAGLEPAAPPSLTVTPLNVNAVLISWKVDSYPWTLEQTTDLAGANTIWEPALQPGTIVDGFVQVVVPRNSDRAFLRLRR